MYARGFWRQFAIGCLLLVLLPGCAAPVQETPTTVPTLTLAAPTQTLVPATSPSVTETNTPKPTSCESVEGICLTLNFNGESCAYTGPTELKPGPVTLIFQNKSDGWAATNLISLMGDKTLQDVIEYNGEEPSTKHAPSWSVSVPDVWKEIEAGESRIWKGSLEPGIHALVCARTPPWPESIGVWLGTGLTVEDG